MGIGRRKGIVREEADFAGDCSSLLDDKNLIQLDVDFSLKFAYSTVPILTLLLYFSIEIVGIIESNSSHLLLPAGLESNENVSSYFLTIFATLGSQWFVNMRNILCSTRFDIFFSLR